MKMKRFFKVTGVATVLTMMMVSTAFAGNKGRKEYRETVVKMEQEFVESTAEMENVQKDNEADALWYIDLSERYKNAEVAPENAEAWEKAKALREEIRELQLGVEDNDEEADAVKKQPGAKKARMAGENEKTYSEVKELRTEMKELADNGDFEAALKLYEEILGVKNERASKIMKINSLWKEIAELLGK